jgi:nucleoside-triphosphatase THEP1
VQPILLGNLKEGYLLNYLSKMNYFRSKRFWIALLVLSGLSLLRLYPYLIAMFLFSIAYFYNRKTIQPLKNYKFWIVILFLVLIVPIFTGTQDYSFLGINYSAEQLQKTLFMTLRGISVFLLFQVLTIDLDIEIIKPIFSKIGIKNFDLLYNLSNEIFPKIKSILNARYTQFRTNWKDHRTIELVFDFFSEIFTDFFLLSDQLSKSETSLDLITPSEFLHQNDLSVIPSLIVIVGDAGAGKTPWIEQLIELLQNKRVIIDGIISKKSQESDDKWYHDLIRISTNEKYQLTTMDIIDTDIKIGKFNLFEDTINWGNNQLTSMKNSDWIIIDEVGLLEFDGGGFLHGLQSAVTNFRGHLVITVRSALLRHLNSFIDEQLPQVKLWKQYIIKL